MTQEELLRIIRNEDGTYHHVERESAIWELQDEDVLFDLARNLTRDRRTDPALAVVAAEEIRDPEKLVRLAVEAADYRTSEYAVEQLEDPELLSVIRKTEDEKAAKERWFSPLEEKLDPEELSARLRILAAERLTDKSPLVGLALEDRSFDHFDNGYPIREELNRMKAGYLNILLESPELLRKYAEQEDEIRALHYMAQRTQDIPTLKCIIEKCENGTVDSSADISPDKEMIRCAAAAAKRMLEEALRVEKLWSGFDHLPEADRAKADRLKLEYETSSRGTGWESADITVNGECHTCNISDVGNTVADFEEYVRALRDNSFGYFTWSGEPGRYTWFLARRDAYIYVEIPGFSGGFFLRTDTFLDAVLGDSGTVPNMD